MSDLNKEGVFEIDRAKDRILNDPFKTPERKKLELEELGITKPKKEADKPQAKTAELTEAPQETPQEDEFEKATREATGEAEDDETEVEEEEEDKEPGLCISITASGNRCKRVAGFGQSELYCRQHAKKG